MLYTGNTPSQLNKSFAEERHLDGGFARKAFLLKRWRSALQIKALRMNKLKGLVFGVLLLLPSVSFAATDNDIRASLVQQLLTLFVQEVNGIQSMQDTIGQSSNPAQFNDLSNLLKSQFSDTENQLAALLNPNSTPTASTQQVLSPQINNTIAGSVPVQSCVDNPSLSLYVSSSTVNSVFVMGTYSTGCDLNVNTKWTYKTDLWNVTGAQRDYDYGIIGHANAWDLQGPEGEQIYNVGYFRATINPYVGQKTATLTVGNITATTTLSQ